MKGKQSFKVGFEGSSLCAIGSTDMISHCVSDVEGSKHDPVPVSGSSESVDINAIIAVPTSYASFVAVSQSVEAPMLDPTYDEQCCETVVSSNASGDLNRQLSINAFTLQPVLELTPFQQEGRVQRESHDQKAQEEHTSQSASGQDQRSTEEEPKRNLRKRPGTDMGTKHTRVYISISNEKFYK